MPALDAKLMQRYRARGFRVLVETGTLFGHGALRASRIFDHVFTIELMQDLHKRAARRFASDTRVTCLVGNSAEVLPDLVSQLPPRTVFFLDAHWSGDSSVDWASSRFRGYGVNTGHLGEPGMVPSSREQVPLDIEVRAIAEGYPYETAIIVDDRHNFGPDGSGRKDHGFMGEDWSHLSVDGLIELVRPRLTRVVEKGDAIVMDLREIPRPT